MDSYANVDNTAWNRSWSKHVKHAASTAAVRTGICFSSAGVLFSLRRACRRANMRNVQVGWFGGMRRGERLSYRLL